MEHEKECRECLSEDQSCFIRKSSSGNFQNLSTKSGKIWLGGTEDLSVIQPFKNYLRTHDFTGCIRRINVDNVDMFKTKPKSSKNIQPSCTRKDVSICKENSCSNKGKCLDLWNDLRCDCIDGYGGKECSTKSKPLTFDKNTYLEYIQTDGYKRNELFKSQLTSKRKRRSTTSDTISIRFRTNEDGNLLYSKQGDDKWSSIRIVSGKVRYENSNTVIVMLDKKINDGEWHTVKASFSDGRRFSFILSIILFSKY